MPTVQFAGLATGIDSKALIDALIAAREKRNELLQANVDSLETENDALEQLNTKLLAFKDLVDEFRTINGGGVSKKASSTNTETATALAGTDAVNGSYALTVTSAASTATASFNDAYTATTQALAPNAVGTVTVSVDVGSGSALKTVSVDITSSTTIQEFVDEFNANSEAAGRISASLVNVGTTASPSYRVVFNSLQSGIDEGNIAFDIPSSGAGFGGNGDLQTRTVSQATNAVFSVSGITGNITRSTNSVDDVITGMTFQLVGAGSTTITVNNDADSTVDAINEIVAAYNDIVEYINENDTITREETSESVTNTYGSLAKATIDNSFLTDFRLALANATSETGTSITSIAGLGIVTERDGTLTVDEDDLRAAIATDSTAVTEVLQDFADTVGGTSGTINQYTKFNGLIDYAQQSNDTTISTLLDSIEQYTRQNDKTRETLELQFARLEALSASLQSAQAQLTAILG